MSLLISNEQYHGSNFLSSNVGDWVSTQFEFLHRVDYDAQELSNKCVYYAVGGVYWWELTDGSEWSDHGFVGGKTIDLIFTDIIIGVTIFPVIIQYIDGAKMFFTANPYPAFLGSQSESPAFDDATGALVNYTTFIQTSAPESLEYDFNLANINNPSLNSLIDGGIQRFKHSSLDSLPILGVASPLIAIGNQSGGYIDDVKIIYLSIVDGYRKYVISLDVFVWPLIQDNQLEPQWFNGVDTIGPNHRVRVFSQLNNANSILKDVSANTDGDVGGFDENYNTSLNPYTLNNVVYTDPLANVISGIDYCGTTHVKAEVTGNTFSPANSKFNCGIVWRTNDADNYSNKITHLGRNLMVAAPIHEFIDFPTPDPSTYNGNTEPTVGAGWSFTNVHFYLVGNLLTFEADIVPNGTNQNFFNALDDGAKKCTLWISHNRTDLDPNDRDRTSIKLYDQDVICAPAVGDPIDADAENFEDHDNIDLSPAITTTEDDVLYTLDFRVNENVQYLGLRASIEMYNTVSGEFFTLEEFFIGFGSIPFISGIYQTNEALNRNFNLPPTTDRNQIRLNRLPAIDNIAAYGLRLEYGFLNLWKYWEIQANANNFFFDMTEPNNGFNKDWQRYGSDPDWTPRMAIFMVKDDVEDYHYSNYSIRPYDDEDVTPVCTFIDLADGSAPTSFVANTLMEVTAVLTWNAGVFNPVINWFEATIEDFEAGNRWVISSVLPQGGIGANPLKPITGQTLLDVVIVGNVATLKYIVDTNIINASKVSITHRAYSVPGPEGKIREDGDPKLKEDGDIKILE